MEAMSAPEPEKPGARSARHEHRTAVSPGQSEQWVPIDGSAEDGCAEHDAASGERPHDHGDHARDHAALDHSAHDHAAHDHAGHYHPDLSRPAQPGTAQPGAAQPGRPRVDVWDLLRFLSELFAFVSLCVWGFVVFPLPWNIVAGIAAPVAAILVWALFRSPKAVFATDTFGKAIAEIVVMSAAAFAWWGMGHPLVAVIWAVVALVIGIVVGRRELNRGAA
jgi:hypothetical protein